MADRRGVPTVHVMSMGGGYPSQATTGVPLTPIPHHTGERSCLRHRFTVDISFDIHLCMLQLQSSPNSQLNFRLEKNANDYEETDCMPRYCGDFNEYRDSVSYSDAKKLSIYIWI